MCNCQPAPFPRIMVKTRRTSGIMLNQKWSDPTRHKATQTPERTLLTLITPVNLPTVSCVQIHVSFDNALSVSFDITVMRRRQKERRLSHRNRQEQYRPATPTWNKCHPESRAWRSSSSPTAAAAQQEGKCAVGKQPVPAVKVTRLEYQEGRSGAPAFTLLVSEGELDFRVLKVPSCLSRVHLERVQSWDSHNKFRSRT